MPARSGTRWRMATRNVRAHVVISGYVQGVSFRYATYHEARRQGVGGWVRNVADGRVEAVFEGAEAAVHRVVEWCERGPPGAFVAGVEASWSEPSGEFAGFSIERTV